MALAAIGASAQIINLFIGFIIGLTTGAGIIIAQYYGAEMVPGFIQPSILLSASVSWEEFWFLSQAVFFLPLF